MSIRDQSVQRFRTFTCDKCGVHEESENIPGEWMAFSYTENTALRLFERVQEFRYESFHIPKQGVRHFCSLKCAKEFLTMSVDLFLAELSPRRKPTNHKKL